MNLNTTQEEAFRQIVEFVESGDVRCFLLKGYAGTGKTFLIRALCEYFSERKIEVAVLAPTGRAARVITQRTGFPASTVHREMYGMERFLEEVIVEHDGREEKTYKLIFKLTDDMGDDGKVFIVDEASMVSDVESDSEFIRFGSGRLLSDLVTFARLKVPTFKNRIIFVGDPMQLPPVGMATSPALDTSYLEKEFGIKSAVFTLTQIMRQEDGLILENAMRLRDMMGSFLLRRFEITTDEKSVTEVTPKEALDAAMDGVNYRRETVFVTQTNAAALRFNENFRERLWGDGMLPVQKNDILMVVRNSFKYQLFNGDLCLVKEGGGNNESIHIPNLNVTLSFRDVTIAYHDREGRPVEKRCKILENALHQDTATLAPKLARALYVHFCIRHPDLSPKKQPREFAAALLDDEYFNALLVKYGYAVTCHKAQGGEWDRAIVYFEKGGQINDDWLRWCYTAITRAKKELFVINAPTVREMRDEDLSAIEGDTFTAGAGITASQPERRVEAFFASAPENILEVMPDMVEEVLQQCEESARANKDQCGGVVVSDANTHEVEFPVDYPFLRAKYRGFSERLAPHGLQIQCVDHQPDKFFVRYTVGDKERRVGIQCYFKKNGIFNQPQIYEKETTTPDLFQLVYACFQSAPLLEDISHIDRNFPFQFPFTATMYESLESQMKEIRVEIVGLEHLFYTERYTVRRELDACAFDIRYTGNQRISCTTLVAAQCTSKEFAAEVMKWLKKRGYA